MLHMRNMVLEDLPTKLGQRDRESNGKCSNMFQHHRAGIDSGHFRASLARYGGPILSQRSPVVGWKRMEGNLFRVFHIFVCLQEGNCR